MLSELHLRVCGVGVRCCMARRYFSLYGWAAFRPVDCICECVVWVFGVVQQGGTLVFMGGQLCVQLAAFARVWCRCWVSRSNVM